MKIGIDPGHGGFDPGAIGHTIGLREKDVTLGISKELARILRENKIDIVLTRAADVALTSNVNDDLRKRTQILNAAKVDYVISVHVNSSDNLDANYIATFIQGTGGQAEQLAKKVQPQLVQATGWPDGEVRVGNLHMTRETSMPAILVECGFISNAEQERMLRQPETQKKLAQAIATGVFAYLGMDAKPIIDDGRTPCKIIIKGKEFPGYVKGGVSYFHNAPVKEVIEAGNTKFVSWDAKAMTAVFE